MGAKTSNPFLQWFLLILSHWTHTELGSFADLQRRKHCQTQSLDGMQPVEELKIQITQEVWTTNSNLKQIFVTHQIHRFHVYALATELQCGLGGEPCKLQKSHYVYYFSMCYSKRKYLTQWDDFVVFI